MVDTRVREAQEIKTLMLQLQAHGGWKHLCEIGKDTMQGMMNDTMNKPCEGVDAVLVQEFAKGKWAGFNAFQLLPQAMIDASNAILETMGDEADAA